MDKFFINPKWEISVYRKITDLIFNPKTNMQDQVREWSCFGSLLPMPFNQKWKKTCWFLHSQPIGFYRSGPNSYAAYFFTGPTRKNTIHHPWQQHTTHTYIFKTRINISTGWKLWWYQSCAKVTHHSNGSRKAWFFSGALHPTWASSWNWLVSFSQHLWSKADHHTITLSLYCLL